MRSETAGELDAESARELLGRLAERSPDLRAVALLGADGKQIAASDDADWAAGAAALWRSADASGPGVREVHVATEDGEVFAVRGSGASIVATSERFALASLMLCDLRAALRELGLMAGAH